MSEPNVSECMPIERRELGYTRTVCAVCGSNWPCAPVAQARQAEQDAHARAIGQSYADEIRERWPDDF